MNNLTKIPPFVAMDDKSGYGKHSSKEVTEVISRNIAADHEKDYDDWLQRFMISERQFPGYLGTTWHGRTRWRCCTSKVKSSCSYPM